MEKYFILFFILILETNSQGSERQIPEDQNVDNGPFNTSITECVVPAPDAIRNGKFEVREDWLQIHLPDGKLHSYELRITCNPGYDFFPRRTSAPVIICIVNRTREEIPECLPTCKRNTPEVLSCGVGADNKETKCFLPSGVPPSSELTSVSLMTANDNQCGRTANFPTSAVSKGVEAKREDAPWHAGIYTKTTRPFMQICGGTIVSTNVVISAAHCFWTSIDKKLPPENFAVALGKIYRPWDDPTDQKNAQKSDILEIRIPPRFHGSATNFQDDIALLILKEVIFFTPYIVPACLDFDYDFDETQLAHGKIGRVVGWGLTSEDGAASPILNKAELPVIDVGKCAAEADPSFLESITSDKICAGYNNGTAVCRGDSGGGLAFQELVDDKNRYFLRGVVSTAPTNDHLCNVYAVATFTHIIRHERFIRNATSQSPPPNIVPEFKPMKPPVLTILNKSPGLGSGRPLFDTPGSDIPFNVTPGLDRKTINDDTLEFDKRPISDGTSGFDDRPLSGSPSSSNGPSTYIIPEVKPYQTTGIHESPKQHEVLCKSEERPHLIGIASYEKPGPYVNLGCIEKPKTPSPLVSNQPLTYTKPGSDIKPEINDGQQRPNNPNSEIYNAFVHDKIYRLPINEEPSINDNPISDDNRPMVNDIPIVYRKAVVYEKTVVYEGPVTYMSHVSDEPDVRFRYNGSPIPYGSPEMYDRLANNEKLFMKEGYRMYYQPPVTDDKPIYKRKSVTDDETTSYGSLESHDYPIVFERPVIYKQSVIYVKPVTYKESKLFYSKNQNQLRRDVVRSATELTNQGVKFEIGIANNEKDTPKTDAKHKSTEGENSSDLKVQSGGIINENKDMTKPNSNKVKIKVKITNNVPTGSSSNQANSNKRPIIQSSINDYDDDDDEHYANPSKPHIFDKDHPANQVINLHKPDQKQPTHWQPLMPESWRFFNQNFHGQNLYSDNKNPASSKDDANSGNYKDSNFNDYVPEGYTLFRQHGLSHQSTNILINTHNGPATIGDVSSVVNFYYKSANRTFPNVEE